ncbi:unnamed protein product, partial [Iphiclides podalirius]
MTLHRDTLISRTRSRAPGGTRCDYGTPNIGMQEHLISESRNLFRHAPRARNAAARNPRRTYPPRSAFNLTLLLALLSWHLGLAQ